MVSFFVNKNDVDIKELEAEAKRVVNLLPKMTPGEQKGKPVNVTYMLPISFNID